MASTINSDTSNGVVVTSDTSGEIELQSAGVTKAKITSSGLQNASGNPITSQAGKNLIINGNMAIAQRATSVTGITAAGYYTVDRFTYVKTTDDTITNEQSTDSPNDAEYSYKITVTTADSTVDGLQFSQIRQVIEGLNTAYLNWGTANAKTITISFWVKSSVTGTYCLGLANDSFTRQYIEEYTIVSANTWEKKTITITGDTTGTWDTDNTRGIIVNWNLACGLDRYGSEGWQTPASAGNAMATSNQVNFLGTTSATFQLALVQLEANTTATPFEHLQYGQQLSLCQRYFQVLSYVSGTNVAVAMSTATDSAITTFYYSQKRATPTVTLPPASKTNGISFLTVTGAYPGTVGTNTADRISVTSSRISGASYVGLAGAGRGAFLYATGDQVITISAEL